jgi:creatinine amidohydrolase
MYMDRKSWNIQEMTSPQVAQLLEETDIVLIPTGSNERHGRHLPLGCDAFQATMVASHAAARAHVPYIPVLYAGYSPHHMRRPGDGTGTITLRGETLRRVYYDVARSLIYHGFSKLIFVNYHGSNIKIMDDVLRRIRYETGAFVACYQHSLERQISLIKDLVQRGTDEETWKTSTWHAAECETSMVMYWDARLVDMEAAISDRAHAPAWLGKDFEKIDGTPTVAFKGAENIWIPMDHYEYSDSATIGNPKGATVELGEALIERMANHLADFVESVRPMKVTIPNRDWPERAW